MEVHTGSSIWFRGIRGEFPGPGCYLAPKWRQVFLNAEDSGAFVNADLTIIIFGEVNENQRHWRS